MSRFCADHRTDFLTNFSVIRPRIACAARGGGGLPAVRGRCGGLVGGGWESSRAARAVTPRPAEPSETAVQNRFHVQTCAPRGPKTSIFEPKPAVLRVERRSRGRGGPGGVNRTGPRRARGDPNEPTRGPKGCQRGPKGTKGPRKDPKGPERGPKGRQREPGGGHWGPAGPQRGPNGRCGPRPGSHRVVGLVVGPATGSWVSLWDPPGLVLGPVRAAGAPWAVAYL